MSALKRHVRWTLPGLAMLALAVVLPSAAAGGKATSSHARINSSVAIGGVFSANHARVVTRLPTGGPAVHGTVPFPTGRDARYRAAKAAAAAEFALNAPSGVRPGYAAGESPLAPPVLKGRNFAGVDQSVACNCLPPDTEGVVGQSHFLETSNSHIDIYQKGPSNPPPLVYSQPASTFWNTGHFPCDQRTLYDSTWKRYIVIGISCEDTGNPNAIFLAASITSNPTAGFYNYGAIGWPDNFCDYPILGQNQDAITVTCNVFQTNPAGGWLRADMFSVAKARIFNGLGFSVPIFTGLPGTLTPPNVSGNDQNGNAYYAAAGVFCNNNTCGSSGIIPIFVGDHLANPSQTSLAFAGNVPIPAYSIPAAAPCGNGNPNSGCIDTLDARFVNASTQTGSSLYLMQSPQVPDGSGFAGLGYYRVDTSAMGAPDYVRTFSSGTSWDFNSSLAANDNGDVVISFTTVCSVTCVNGGNQANPEVRMTGRQTSDPGGPGTTSINMPGTLLRISPAPYFGGRWGDYSAVSGDPQNYTSEGCGPFGRFWTINEWDSTSTNWSTHISRVGYC